MTPRGRIQIDADTCWSALTGISIGPHIAQWGQWAQEWSFHGMREFDSEYVDVSDEAVTGLCS
jgi:hypothetical protein